MYALIEDLHTLSHMLLRYKGVHPKEKIERYLESQAPPGQYFRILRLWHKCQELYKEEE